MSDNREKRMVVKNGRPPRKRETELTEFVKPTALEKRMEKSREWDEAKDIERVRHGVDRPMLFIIILLICLGSVMVFSASYPNAQTFKGDGMYYIIRHIIFVAIGTGAMVLLAALPYTTYKVGAVWVGIISIVLLVLVLVMGAARGVAQRWIVIGGSFTLQPSETAKIAVILVLAWYLDKNSGIINGIDSKKKIWRGIAVPGFIMAVFAGLVLLEKHLSGTLIIAAIAVCIVFLSGANIWKMAISYGIPATILVAGYLMKNSYALKRILTYTDENADTLDELWQTTQGLYAIGNGGVLGTGIGKSNLKYNYVSEAQNDFIFSIWCEETGFIGAILLIILYGLFIWRGMTIARRAPDTFSSLVAFGITCQVGIQAALNMLVVTDMIFNTGISLPFFSYGGSAIIVLLGEMGILLSISKHSYQKKI